MNKIIAYMALFLVCISAVFAANTLTLNFYDENGNQVTHVETSIFQCTDSSCKELTGTSARDRIDYADSGSTNIATLSIPKTSTQTWYIHTCLQKNQTLIFHDITLLHLQEIMHKVKKKLH